MKKILWMILIVILVIAGFWFISKGEQTAGQIKIGAILPLTGSAANYGEDSRAGIMMAQELLAKKYPDLKLDVVYQDSLYSPKGGVDAYQKLAQTDKISATIIGASFVAIPIKPLAEKDGVLQMAIWSAAPSYTDTHNLNFRTTLTADDTIPPILAYMNANKLQKLAILNSENEFGASHKDSFVKMSPGAGVEVVFSEGFGNEAKDFRTTLLKIKSAAADSIFFIGTYGQLVEALKQSKELGIEAQFISQGAAEEDGLIKGAGSAAEGLVYAYPFDNLSAGAKEFSETYKNKYGKMPNQYSAEAFVGLQVIGEAINLCRNKVDTVCWKEKLDSMKNFQTILGSGSFNDLGDLKMGKVFMKTVKNGQFVKLEDLKN